jgi:hypothetical protein
MGASARLKPLRGGLFVERIEPIQTFFLFFGGAAVGISEHGSRNCLFSKSTVVP